MRTNKIVMALAFILFTAGYVFPQFNPQFNITRAEFDRGITRQDDNWIHSTVNGRNYIVDRLTRRDYQVWVNGEWQSVMVGTERVAAGQNRNFHMTRGRAAFDRGDFYSLNDAISHFTMAISINPNDAEAHYRRARASYALVFEVRRPPADFIHTPGRLALFNQHIRSPFPSATDVARAIQLDPEHADALLFRGRIRGGPNWRDLRRADFHEVLRLQPNNAEVLWRLGDLYVSIFFIDHNRATLYTALEFLDRSIAINPTSTSAFYHRSRVHHRLGNYQQARSDNARAFGR